MKSSHMVTPSLNLEDKSTSVHTTLTSFSNLLEKNFKMKELGPPGSPVKTPCFPHCQGRGFDPWSSN